MLYTVTKSSLLWKITHDETEKKFLVKFDAVTLKQLKILEVTV